MIENMLKMQAAGEAEFVSFFFFQPHPYPPVFQWKFDHILQIRKYWF